MFTGLVEGVGKIIAIEGNSQAKKMWIECPFSLAKEALGASVAVNGCCLSIVKKRGKAFLADLSLETLKLTNLSLVKVGDGVNIERPLKVGGRLGGHYVLGHVDGLAILKNKEMIQTKSGNYLKLSFIAPASLRPYLVYKGSIAIDGVSLTINDVKQSSFSVMIIPHTQSQTTLTALKVGAKANLEVDVLAKFCANLLKPYGKNKRSNCN